MALALRLNLEDERPETSWHEKETARRLMLACFVADGLTAGGVRELRCAPLEAMHIQLPCNERNFGLGIPCTTGPLRTVLHDLLAGTLPRPNTGLVACSAILFAVRQEILQ